MNNQDRAGTIDKYRKAYANYGYSPKSLGWDKGRQEIRFDMLLSFFECEGKSILDIGCGFGDLNRVLSKNCGMHYEYTGVDLVCELIDEGRRLYNQSNVSFLNVDFLEYSFEEKFDIIIASGIFNHKFDSGENDLFVDRVFEKAWEICNEGFAFDFLSDRVDYRYSHTYHNSPERILGLAYNFSRNISLRNDYMPFEFCLYVGKDASFDKEDVVFNSYKKSSDTNQYNDAIKK